MKPLASTLTLIIALLLPSLPIVKRAIGTPGMIAYLIVGSLTIVTLIRLYQSDHPITQLANRPRTPILLSLALTLTLISAYTIVFPRVNSQTPGEGSDRDDALNVAATRLLQGKYPYSETTYLSNPISPLPGSILFAVPFVLLGNSALQNLFWVAILLAFLRHRLKANPRLNSFILLSLFICAQLFYEVVTGSDLLSNAIFVAILGIFWVETIGSTSANRWLSLLLSIGFGIALASRANFALALPPLAAYLTTKTDWQTALRHASVVVATFLVLCGGFYIASPVDFSPLHTASEIGVLDVIIPRVGSVIIPLVMLAVTAYYTAPAVSKRWRAVMGGVTVVQAIPVLVGTLLIIGFSKKVNVGFLFFGTTFMIWGILYAIESLDTYDTSI